ncbi:MAG: efflux RND transporter permease subunit [Thermoanaerobaculia bacterium]|nr:efflux RND transporter permease subunit [Thermoanaerobaculia bacterium]
MTLYNLAIRRPVLATVLSITIVLFGAISFTYLGVREFPAVDPPVITVTANYRGANADVIESQVTEPLEDSINGIAGIRTLTSVSREGRSTVTVEFDLDADLERAANDVRDRVSQALDNLPPDIDPPEVSKADADSQPILMFGLQSDRRNLLDLTRVADEIFVERLQTIPGVARVDVWGERTYSMRLWLDPQKLASYQLSPIDVLQVLQRENVELPAGRIEGNDVQLNVRTLSRLATAEDFNDLILKAEGGRVVRFRDVGTAELGARNERTALKMNGKPMVGLSVRPLPGANFIEISDLVNERISQLRQTIPEDLSLTQGFDQTRFVRRSVAEVQETVLASLLLVVAVIFLFLRDWRTTLIPVLAIPVSLVGAFFVMYLAGYSINVLTLLALVLAIGIVVDDAIIVLENIYAKIEGGKQPLEAGIEGTREIFFAVVATTLALIAVFLPILFMGGLAGRLFREFGVTLAGAVAISALVALTLTPMLATRLLKHRAQPPWIYRVTEPFFEGLTRAYGRTLDGFLRTRWLAPPLLLASFLVIYGLYHALPAELAPTEDRSYLRLNSRGPEGATFAYTDRFMDELTALIEREVPERQVIVSVTAPGFGAAGSTNNGSVRLMLIDPAERTRSQSEIARDLGAKVAQLAEARTSIAQDPTIALGRRAGLPMEFVIQAPNLEKLKEALPRFLAAARQDPTFPFVDVDLQFSNPEIRIEIDRARARDLGVSALDIARTLQLALSEQRLGFFQIDGKQYEVIGQVRREYRNDTVDLRNLYVPSSRGPVVLDKVVRVSEQSSPPQLFRFDRYLSATVSAALAPGKTLGDGIEAMERIAEEVLDDSFATRLSGQARDFSESNRSLLFVFLLAFVLVFLVLATQFESFLDPFIVMLTVPLSLAGAFGALWATGQTFNIFSQIGMIMLVGLTTKNGILIVEFANQRKSQGLAVTEAVRGAATARLRPVLMTSLSTILGILPIALALGAGSESRVPMGIAVVGGLVVGTVLTLYVVPAVYSLLSQEGGKAELVEEPEEEAAA